ncbi:MAG: aminotransferase class I/II-fold pyridoxal phosphate-dependent enzyme [Proteobacteria bacterium]|nr:aminotransferase class I/II-fold pyridoxal phosphate-dependent enzyme [Pseudomonadota bacterium]NIS70283.1 aminotransferase class I/II-fold pyridoxal phosphate-dependent enzyme [Pseudomonadota bacterium]
MGFETIDEGFLRRRAALKWTPWPEDVIPLSVADIDFRTPREIKEGIIRALDEDRTPYGAYSGDPDVLEVVCEKLNRVNRIPATVEDVHMVPGTMFGIFVACYHTLRPGDEALICPAPIYPPFIENIENAHAVPVFNSVDFSHNLSLDLDDLKRQITPRTRLLMVCNPHNPTGRVLSGEELEAVGQIAQENDLFVFVDELYEDMILDGEHLSLASLSPDLFQRTLTVFGFSKAFGIPGFRIAYIVNRGKHMREIRKRIHGMIVHTDTLAQAAAKAALIHGDAWLSAFRSHLKRMRDYTLKRLGKIDGVWCPKPQATPFVFPNVSSYGMTSQQIVDYLKKEARVIVQSGSDFGPHGEGHLRINFATALSVLKEAFDRIEGALVKLS